MDNVVFVNFNNNNQANYEVMLTSYLTMLSNYGLDEDDVKEVEEAIRCYECYENSDDVVQRFADEFHSCP